MSVFYFKTKTTDLEEIKELLGYIEFERELTFQIRKKNLFIEIEKGMKEQLLPNARLEIVPDSEILKLTFEYSISPKSWFFFLGSGAFVVLFLSLLRALPWAVNFVFPANILISFLYLTSFQSSFLGYLERVLGLERIKWPN